MKKIGAVLLAFVLCLSLVGCGKDETSSQINGKVSLDGSTSMEKLMKGLQEAMREDYPQLLVEVQFTGSGAGIKAVLEGIVDIGNSSRALKDEEKEKGLVENIVALDGIAVIVDKNNAVKNLTQQQLTDIFTGKIKNWNEVGGANQAIVVVGREDGSGTRDGFESILNIAEKTKYANVFNETGPLVAQVQKTAGAIGYASLDIAQDSQDNVHILSIDGVEPSETTILDGTYTLQRPFVMVTKGEITQQKSEVKAVFDFIASEKGQAIIKEVGLVVPHQS